MFQRSKYRNRKIVFDNIKFDSKKEAEKYCELMLLKNAGGRRPTGKFTNERMNRFQDVVVRLTAEFKRVEFKWIPRHLNYMADIQSKASLIYNHYGA